MLTALSRGGLAEGLIHFKAIALIIYVYTRSILQKASLYEFHRKGAPLYIYNMESLGDWQDNSIPILQPTTGK